MIRLKNVMAKNNNILIRVEAMYKPSIRIKFLTQRKYE